MTCERCYKDTISFTGSYFDMEMVCFNCAEKERAHPDYARAVARESEAVRQGDFNFPGIGLPNDLR